MGGVAVNETLVEQVQSEANDDTDWIDTVLKPSAENAEPKRGRGRPRKEGGSSAQISSSNKGRFSIAKTRDTIGSLLEMGNQFFISQNQTKPYTLMYALQPTEIGPLADALAGEVAASPKLQKLMTGAGKVSPHMTLAFCLGSMTVSRYLMYQAVKAQVSQPPPRNAWQGNANDDTTNPAANVSDGPREYIASVPVGNGGTYGGDGGDGNGKDEAHIAFIRH